MALGLTLAMSLGTIPYNVLANSTLESSGNIINQSVAQSNQPTDATSSATYYTKPNWEARIKDASRWKVEDSQNLVRVTTSDPVRMNDIDYDGMYINANGRYVIRLIYKERTQAPSAVWHKALINFGDLDEYIDFSNSYVFGRDGKTRYTFDPVKGIKGRGFDVRNAAGDRTNGRKNLPINLVLKDGVTLDNLPKKNYIIQMRLCNDDYTRVYAYAPGKSSMDYSTYTKTTSVSLLDNLNNLFIKGGYQEDSNNATSQEFFMSEFIANPDRYKDASNLGIIRTQYMGQTSTIVREEVGGEPIAFTQVFDSNLLNYLKADDDGNVGYVRLLTVAREESKYAQDVGIKLSDFNKIKVENGQELAYLVFAIPAYRDLVAGKSPKVNVVEIPKNDQYTMLSGNYITGIDYVVDKKKFEDTFSSKYTRKLDYSTMSGWTNPNKDGWLVYEKPFTNDYVVQEGDSFMVDAGAGAKGKQIMIQVGGEQAILRRSQGYYNGYATSKSALDNFEEIADGIFQFTLGEGTTVKNGKSLKIYMPYTSSFDGDEKINFLQIHNGTKLNEGAANLTLQKDRNINMHLYKQGKKGYFVLKYTLKNGNPGELKFIPKVLWQYNDEDEVMTGVPNKATGTSGGNFYINTKKLKPGTDIIVESYGDDNQEIVSERSLFKYIPLEKSQETVKLLTWTDHSDKRSVLSINKSLYTPYQVLFTNDYADGNAYKDPRVVPTNVADFNRDTTKIVGYTKYDSGKVRTLYEGPQKLYGKVEADGNEYDNDGNLKGQDVRKDVTIAKENIFDAQFAEKEKTYKAYEYTFDLNKMLPYHSDDKTETKLTLLKDMKFVSTASDGSSLPSDLIETRVRARVLFDANGGKLTEDGNQVDKAVKIVPDNLKFYGDNGYAANGFEGANADTNTGDKFPDAPKLQGKNFLGWVTEKGKTDLGNTIVSATAFNNLPKEQVFTNTTPVTKHLIVYAIYSEDTVVTLDANGGVFKDGKGQITKKPDELEGIKAPTKEGYTFKGWADSKEATEANVADPSKLTESKTVYAVWVQEDANKLNLNAPENPVPVSDKTDLSEKEKDAVRDAVIKANPDASLTKDDIKVSSDGKVTVTKDGKTGELTPEQTVKQKEVINNIKPPEKPVEVKNPSNLDETEKKAVKDAIIKANPDLNLKPEEVTVDEKGNVKINQGGKTGTVPAEKTVVKADNVIKLNNPTPVEVKDVNNLTPTEKEAVKNAVIAANSGLSKDKISVDGNGNVTVTDGDKTGKLDASVTVKPFDRTGKTLNAPKELTEVSDKTNLTNTEKEAVREAVKAANPDLAFKDEEIEVANDGTVKVPMGTNQDGTTKYETIDKSKTVKEDDKNKTISLKAPKVTPVVNPRSLEQGEKDKVKAAVIEANPSIATGYKITVADDGSVTVTKDGKSGMLLPADTVVKKLEAPEVVSDEDGSVKVLPNDDRTKEVVVTYKDPSGTDKIITAKKGANDKWAFDPANVPDGVKIKEDTGAISIPADKIQNNTQVSATAKDGDNTSDGSTVTSKDNKAPAAPEISEDAEGNVTVTLPKDKDATKVTVKYRDANGDEKTVEVTKTGNDWALPQNAPQGITIAGGKITIPDANTKNGTRVSAQAEDDNGNKTSERGITIKSDADRIDPTIPEKTPVADPTSLTETEQKAVKEAIEKSNENKFPQETTVSVDSTGKATITYPDGSTDTISAPSLVEKVDKTELKKEVDKEATTKADVKYTNASQTKKDDYDAALAKAKKVLGDPNALQKDIDDALKALQEAEKALDGTENPAEKTTSPTITKPNAGDKEIKGTAPAGSDVTVTLPDGTEIKTKADQDGNWTAKLPEGKEIAENDEIKVVAKDGDKEPSAEVKGTAGPKASEEKPTAPAAPTVKANDDGSVTVTPPTDVDTKEVKVTYTDNDGNEKTVTATKDPQTGKWTLPAGAFDVSLDPITGLITIPADKVKDGTEVSAVAKDNAGNASTPTDTSKANAKTPGSTKPGDADDDVVIDNGKKPLYPTDYNQYTGLSLKNPSNLDSISAIDEDGSYVPVEIDDNGNIIVKPGRDVDGPIKVTIKTNDGKERIIFIDILGHAKGRDDNNNSYPSKDGGEYIIPGIRYRDHKTPTHPVYVTVPEKTETGVKVHDTLWYVFRINDFQYEVVRNGVVTKRLMDVTPVLQNGRTMLPLRYVAEALQADVKWDAKTRTATFTKDGLTASIQIDSDEIVLSNGKTVKMDSKPLNINDRILVSVTNVANVFGLTNGNTQDKADQDIEWEQQDKSATIYIRR
ncbi:stalk domain-containing protein [Peptoniphilus genitalis]